MKPLTEEIKSCHSKLSNTYELRGVRPAWRPLVASDDGSHASLQLSTAERFVKSQRNHMRIVTHEVPIEGSNGLHPGFVTTLTKHIAFKNEGVVLPKSADKIHEFCRDLATDVAETGIKVEQGKRSMNFDVERKLTNLNDEFYVICLLNILYGDPRMPLHRLLPAFQGSQANENLFNR